MKTKLLIAFVLIANLLNAQNNNNDVNKFILLFKAQLSKLAIGKIEEHYDQGYFKALSESEYFDKNNEIGISSVYQSCAGKDAAFSKQVINNFLEQHKKLKNQRKEIESKMHDLNFIKSFLKIRIYPEELRDQYYSQGIVKVLYKGLVEVIVLDLPSGIGSLEKKYLEVWKKTENEIYLLAKENTLKNSGYKFEKAEVAKSGEEFYLLSSDTDMFVTSSVLDLKKTVPPVGKYGTLIALPNNSTVVALPLNDKLKIDQFCLSFMDLVNYMYESKDTKPLSDHFFWLHENEIFFIEKDTKNNKLIYPSGLQKFL